MKKMKVVVVYGTRPELIKLIPLITCIKETTSFDLTVINTGQHKEMVHQIEQVFNIKPDHDLGIMVHNQTLGSIMTSITQKVEPILTSLRPDLVIVQGDTSTVATVGMVCFYNHISIAHVEAGLRSFNLMEPFPEEFNRRLISLVAKYNFAPTSGSAQNLLNEGVHSNKVFVTGNTVVDMVRLVKEKFTLINGDSLRILITAHRRENHGEGIRNICHAVKKILSLNSEVSFIWPVHPNPNVKTIVHEMLSGVKRVELVEPLEYVDLMKEMNDAYLIWSDSGGIQEECPSFKKPVLILRNVTERPEVVECGFGSLVGTDTDVIIEETLTLLNSPQVYAQRISGDNPFGNGRAAESIVNILLNAEQN